MKLSKVILSTIAAQGIVSCWPHSTPFDPNWPYSIVFIIEKYHSEYQDFISRASVLHLIVPKYTSMFHLKIDQSQSIIF